MHDAFWIGYEIENFIFYGFNITTWQGMLATCIGTASYCFLLVGLMFIKETLVHWASAQRQGRALVSQSQMLEVWTSTWTMHVVQGLINCVQLTSGYFIMLIVMSYNVYLCVSVLAGSSLGYYVFNPHLSKKRVILTRRQEPLCASNDAEENGALLEPRETAQPVIVGPSSSSSRETTASTSIYA